MVDVSTVHRYWFANVTYNRHVQGGTLTIFHSPIKDVLYSHLYFTFPWLGEMTKRGTEPFSANSKDVSLCTSLVSEKDKDFIHPLSTYNVKSNHLS